MMSKRFCTHLDAVSRSGTAGPRRDGEAAAAAAAGLLLLSSPNSATASDAEICGLPDGPAWSKPQTWDAGQRVVTAAGVPNWRVGPRTAMRRALAGERAVGRLEGVARADGEVVLARP